MFDLLSRHKPVNNLNAVGRARGGLTQKTSDLVVLYNPGSIINGIARLVLQKKFNIDSFHHHRAGKRERERRKCSRFPS